MSPEDQIRMLRNSQLPPVDVGGLQGMYLTDPTDTYADPYAGIDLSQPVTPGYSGTPFGGPFDPDAPNPFPPKWQRPRRRQPEPPPEPQKMIVGLDGKPVPAGRPAGGTWPLY